MTNEAKKQSKPERASAREVAARFAAIIESTDDAIISKTLDGKITSWNPAAERMFGYAEKEVLGRSITILFPPDRMHEETSILAQLQNGERVDHFETVRVRKDGQHLNVAATISPIRDAKGHLIGISKILRDTTQSLKTKHQLKLLDTCIDNLNDIVLVTDADVDEPGPRIVFVNKAFERLTGYTLAETLGKSPRFLQGEKTDRRVLDEIREALVQQKPIRRHLVNYGKDGTAYWLDIDIVPIFDTAGKCTHFAAIERDITERKKAEEALRASEERYRTTLDNIVEGGQLLGFDWRYLYLNKAAADNNRRPNQELLGRKMTDVWPGLEHTSIFSLFKRCMEERVPLQTEIEFVFPDGGSGWFDVKCQPVPEGIFILSVDISERKRSEERITEQAALLDKARDAILVCDLKGKIIFWNEGAERLYGWKREEVIGRSVENLFYATPDKFRELNAITLEKGEWAGEIEQLTKDKRTVSVDARWTLVRDQEGRPRSVLAINTDITERKKIETQFMRAQRMESIGTLAGGIAHDLNNILTPIMMSIDVLKTTSNNPQTRQILETLEISAKRGADIVRQVLSFARGLEGARIEVQPAHLLKDVQHILKDTFPKNIALHLTVPRDPWTILADPTQIHQVLLNLSVNARDAMPDGGLLNLSVENRTLDEQYIAMNMEAKAGPYLVITVADTGTGIPAHVLNKIFEPFYTTKEIGKGTGLGLSTVMAIVKSHGGFVTVYSEVNQGTTFKVYLPAQTSSISKAEQAEVVNLPRGKGETVLVVDDEASILTITGQTLQAFGYHVLTASDGAEAIAVFAQNRDKINVVLTDMMMPVMDGAATIHALLRIAPTVKIIAASGLNANGGVAKASASGIKHFLSKPYTAGTLLKTLRMILDEA